MPQLELKREGELERVIGKLVELFYPEFFGLDFVVLRRSDYFPGSTRTVARIEKLSGFKAWLYRQTDGEQMPVFVIQVVEPQWLIRTAEQKLAILDHELSHLFWSDTTGEPCLNPEHDIEENAAIVRRHGLYHEGLEIFAEALATGIESSDAREEIRREILEPEGGEPINL